MNLTNLEVAMIKEIAYSDYTSLNGATPKCLNDIGWVWANCVIYSNADKGVFSSLVKKGLAVHSGNSGEDACVTLTEAGFQAFQTI